MLLRMLLMRGFGIVLMMGGVVLLLSQFPVITKGIFERIGSVIRLFKRK